MVESRAPIRMTQREGQESRATVRPAEKPNWSRKRNPSITPPKNRTQVRSGGGGGGASRKRGT